MYVCDYIMNLQIAHVHGQLFIYSLGSLYKHIVWHTVQHLCKHKVYSTSLIVSVTNYLSMHSVVKPLLQSSAFLLSILLLKLCI